MATITNLTYGFFTHGMPMASPYGYSRYDAYTPYLSPRHSVSGAVVMCASLTDDTPLHTGPYAPECPCCWLQHPHTTAYHMAQRAV